MSPDSLFKLCGDVAVLGWLLLIFFGRVRVVAGLVAGFVVPALIGIVYACVVVLHWHERTGGFGSLGQVHGLFENRWLLLGGWVHYLAFDLFIGAWEARDAKLRQISHYFVVPCLTLTFLFGPVGLLLYLTLRVILGNRAKPSVESSSQDLA